MFKRYFRKDVNEIVNEIEESKSKIRNLEFRIESLKKGDGFYDVGITFFRNSCYSPLSEKVSLSTRVKKRMPLWGRRKHSDNHIEYYDSGDFYTKEVVKIPESNKVICEEIRKIIEKVKEKEEEKLKELRKELELETKNI